MNFKPLGNRALAERTQEEEKTASGIYLPETSKEKPKTGKVLAVGDSVKEVCVDDIIMFGKFAGTDIVLDGKEYLILEVDDITGIILNKE